MPTDTILVVGAGLAGAVVARELAERAGKSVLVVDERSHVAGNCHTERDEPTGVMVHRYGPHIFNTDDPVVWQYVNRFMEFRPYINRVKAVTRRGVFALPINLHTINQFFNRTFSPAEARAFVEALGDKSIREPKTFQEQALRFVGRELYECFLYGYTKKQWGCEPSGLPASILKRLPVRFDYNDNYYSTAIQGIPVEGYTKMVERMLDHPRIEVRLEHRFTPGDEMQHVHTFYSGPLDAFFCYRFGRLGYRTVTFEPLRAEGDYQGNAVINYPDLEVPWTRIHEHKHFCPWEAHAQTIAFREYSKATAERDVPYYPIRSTADMCLLGKYQELASVTPNVSFIGRLGTYQYLDMDDVIAETLALVDRFLRQPAGFEPQARASMAVG